MSDDEKCPCGRPLHYANPNVEQFVRAVVECVGPFIEVESTEGLWLVPRHYVALHGLTAVELPLLAKKYAWARVIGKKA